MASTSFTSALCFSSQNPIRNLQFSSPIFSSSSSGVAFASISTALTSCFSLSPSNTRFSSRFTRNCSSSTAPVRTLDYEEVDWELQEEQIRGDIYMQDSLSGFHKLRPQGWDDAHSKVVAQAALSALKQLILSDKSLPDKKSLYIRLGCRGDWPNIKPPGWDPVFSTRSGLRSQHCGLHPSR